MTSSDSGHARSVESPTGRNRKPRPLKKKCKHGHSLHDAPLTKEGHRECRHCRKRRNKARPPRSPEQRARQSAQEAARRADPAFRNAVNAAKRARRRDPAERERMNALARIATRKRRRAIASRVKDFITKIGISHEQEGR